MQIQQDFFLVERQWGHYLQFTQNELTTVKLLRIEKGKSISYQYHNYRKEKWFLISGRCWYVNGNKAGTMHEGDCIIIEKLSKHRLEGLEDSLVLEISSGIFDEEDIVRC